MKKILGLTIAAVLIIGLVAGGTWAYFTDTETLTTNTFTAGIIDLELTSDGVVTVDGSLDDMKPCQTGYLVITLTNGTAETGHNPMHVWKHIYNVSAEENGITAPECVCTEYGGTWNGSSCSDYSAKNDIDCFIHFDMWIDKDADPYDYDAAGGDVLVIDETTGWLLSDNLIDFNPVAGTDPDDNGISCYWIYLGVLDPGETMVIVQSFHLDATVDNWAQSDKVTFSEDFFAVQSAGDEPAAGWESLLPGASPTELPGHGIDDGDPDSV